MTKHVVKLLFNWAVIIICALVFASLITGYASAADVVPAPTVTLQSAMVDIIGQATSGVKAGVAFLQQEIPDVIRQLLIWKAASALVWATFSLLVALSCIPVTSWARKYHKTYKVNDFPGHVFIAGFSLFASAIGAARFVVNGLEALQIYIAPKVWLIEYAASLVK